MGSKCLAGGLLWIFLTGAAWAGAQAPIEAKAEQKAEVLEEKDALIRRNDEIFAKLEEALTVARELPEGKVRGRVVVDVNH